MSETTADGAVASGKHSRKQDAWVAVLYLAVTLIVNLGALIAVPKFLTPEIARSTLPYYALPVLWAGYLLLMNRRTQLRWVGYLAALPALLWLLAVIGDVRFIFQK